MSWLEYDEKGDALEISLIVLRETDKALLVQSAGEDNREVWIPKSQILEPDGGIPEDLPEVVDLEVREWIVDREDLWG